MKGQDPFAFSKEFSYDEAHPAAKSPFLSIQDETNFGSNGTQQLVGTYPLLKTNEELP
jgi:hypothetical protein